MKLHDSHDRANDCSQHVESTICKFEKRKEKMQRSTSRKQPPKYIISIINYRNLHAYLTEKTTIRSRWENLFLYLHSPKNYKSIKTKTMISDKPNLKCT